MQNLEDAELDRRLTSTQAGTASTSARTDPTAAGEAGAAAQPQTPTQLWVDAYAPRSYLQLLSMEGVNAQVLSWLRSWNSTVFPDAHPPEGALPRNCISGRRLQVTLPATDH